MGNEELTGIAKVLGDELAVAFREMMDAGEADVKLYAAAMAKDALRIVKGTAAADIGAELRAQALLLAEKYRIRATADAMDWIVSAAKLAASVALKVGEAYLTSKLEGGMR